MKNYQMALLLGSLVLSACSSKEPAIPLDSEETLVGEEISDSKNTGASDKGELDGLLDQTENPDILKQTSESDSENDPIEVLEVEEKTDPATRGLVRFFSGVNRGFLVKGIRWNSELSQENPGVDCKLRKKGPGLYSCLATRANQSGILTIRETKKPDQPTQRKLSRITFDGKGIDNKNRITEELKSQGYTYSKSSTREKIQIESFLEDERQTRADLLWVASKNSFTLILRPFSETKEKARPKGSKPPVAQKRTKAKKVKSSGGRSKL